MPAGRKSLVYWCLPVTNALPSTFGIAFPAIVHCVAGVMGSSAGRFCASVLPRASSAYLSERPEAGSLTFASTATNPVGATFHSLAATPTSRSRAAAATRRNCGVIVGVVRLPNVPAAALARNGVTIVTGDFEDQKSLERAARGVDTVFAMSTPYERGADTETREGINILRAASAVGVTHLVYTSVAGADRASGIPHFDSKFEVEKEMRRSGVPFTIVAPVFFMENFLADWLAAGIAKGSIAMALPATRRLQQIAVADIARFTALVIERRDGFLGKRIDIASDELTGATAAAAISEASGRQIEYTALPIDAVRQWNDDL